MNKQVILHRTSYTTKHVLKPSKGKTKKKFTQTHTSSEKYVDELRVIACRTKIKTIKDFSMLQVTASFFQVKITVAKVNFFIIFLYSVFCRKFLFHYVCRRVNRIY